MVLKRVGLKSWVTYRLHIVFKCFTCEIHLLNKKCTKLYTGMFFQWLFI